MANAVPEFTDIPDDVKRFARMGMDYSPPERIEKALSFQPGPGDVCLASGIKCGTTWTQQVQPPASY